MKNLFFTLLLIAAVALSSCSESKKNEIQLTSTDQTMFYEDEFQIEATSDTAITYTSENEFHATVSADGLITAGHVGETNILISNGEDTKTLKVTVNPKSNLYPEPAITFGMSRSELIAILGTPDYNQEDSISYHNYSTVASHLICLIDASDRLSNYLMLVDMEYTSGLTDFLTERYFLASTYEKDRPLFANGFTHDTATMGVKLQPYFSLDDPAWLLSYYPMYDYSISHGL